MKEHILVVGGYGHVGKMICSQLGELYPGRVIAAGRSLDRAKQYCRTTGGKVKPLQLNVYEPCDPQLLEQIRVVVMCLDQNENHFVKSCLLSGTHYIDISASYAFLQQVEKLHDAAKENGVSGLLSVGLAPGLTNLMALQAIELMDDAQQIDITIMLGIGDEHGQAAIEWTVQSLSSSFSVTQGGIPHAVTSFSDGKRVDFGGAIGTKTAYRFNFSDQHILPKTLGIPTVSTRLCFDSEVLTRGIAAARSVGLLKLFTNKWMEQIMVHSMGRVSFGKADFAVKVDGYGIKDGKPAVVECFLRGKHEACMTAQTAVFAAQKAYEEAFAHGVYHIEQLIRPNAIQSIINNLADYEVRRDSHSQMIHLPL
ncbi:saccharopine dehydrogenase family protein [Paenibacillus sp. 1001270B_150601_E10]|uniref:saccharopine dehydrogenase family protein n=1 Tax=Paenibacillus sp. 1001270B_150601_E10 TaxID=2787079 RepID=UPI0018A0A3F4|nr:saccharopine dehydrogenase NADP-binding domain-containing protein [Paenibacillus sp. 1001270B_150601_E10]